MRNRQSLGEVDQEILQEFSRHFPDIEWSMPRNQGGMINASLFILNGKPKLAEPCSHKFRYFIEKIMNPYFLLLPKYKQSPYKETKEQDGKFAGELTISLPQGDQVHLLKIFNRLNCPQNGEPTTVASSSSSGDVPTLSSASLSNEEAKVLAHTVMQKLENLKFPIDWQVIQSEPLILRGMPFPGLIEGQFDGLFNYLFANISFGFRAFSAINKEHYFKLYFQPNSQLDLAQFLDRVPDEIISRTKSLSNAPLFFRPSTPPVTDQPDATLNQERTGRGIGYKAEG